MSIEAWAVDSLSSDAKVIRNALGALINPAGGLVAAGGLELAQKGTPNMSVTVKGGTPAEGACFIPAWTTGSGAYFFHNTANFECPIEAAGASLPRVDTIVAQILDKGMGSAESKPQIVALKGTEKAGANKENLEGVAAVPNGCLVLGYVEVPAKAASITTTNIKNVAKVAQLGIGGAGAWQNLTFPATTEARSPGETPAVRLEQGGVVARLRGMVKVKAGKTVAANSVFANFPVASFQPGFMYLDALQQASGGALAANYIALSTISGLELVVVKEMPENTILLLDGLTYSLT